MGFSLLFGSAVSLAVPQTDTAAAKPGFSVTLTAYNAVPWQTKPDPSYTASGAASNPEVIAARSQDLGDELPFGTIIELDGSSISSDDTCGYDVVAPIIGYRVIEDTMNKKFTDRIDVLLDTGVSYKTADRGWMNAANVLGICRDVTIRVVGHVDLNHIPKTQAALAKLVTGTSDSLAIK